MVTGKYVATVGLLLAVAYLYEKYKQAEERVDPGSDYHIVRKYLLKGQDAIEPGRPILWIHADSDINARWWPTFGSRNTRCSNQPYELLTVGSIVNKCKDDFLVCVIQDKDFSDLVPDWKVDLRKVAEPIRSNMRRLAIARLLHTRGGLLVPSTFLAFRSLHPIYKTACACPGGMVVAELQTQIGRGPALGEPGEHTRQPRTDFMGCTAGSESMHQYTALLERICESDYTAASAFEGQEEAWCKRQAEEGLLCTVPPELVGVHDDEGKPVGIERLLGSTYIPLCSRAFGLYVPSEQVKRRTSYAWFTRQSTLQAISSDTALGKYLLVTTAEG